MKKGKDLYYFAHPYSVKDTVGNSIHVAEEANFNLACLRTAELLKKGYFVYSPIAHTHPVHIRDPKFISEGEYLLWLKLDNLFIEKTNFRGIILAPGWEKSNGCIGEKKKFEKKNLEVLFYKDIMAERNL